MSEESKSNQSVVQKGLAFIPVIVGFVALVGCSTFAYAASLETPAPEMLAAQRCVSATVQEVPGHFSDQPFRQVVRVDRQVSDQYGCRFQVSIADADNPLASGRRMFVAEVHGPGQAFSDGYWHEVATNSTFSIQVVHLEPLHFDQVLVTEFPVDQSDPIRMTLVGFTRGGQTATLLKIADAGILRIRAEGAELAITAFAPNGRCHTCGETKELKLRFDPAANSLALVTPTPEAISLYRTLISNGSELSN